MRCIVCDTRLGGILGALRTRAVSCPNEGCEATICAHCLPDLTESQEIGLGPFRRARLEIRCPECDELLHRTEFKSELHQSVSTLVDQGRKRARDFVVNRGIGVLRRTRRGAK